MSNTENFHQRSADKVLTANDLFLSSACVTERTAMVREFDIHKVWAVVHLGRAVQESVSRAARSRLNRLVKEQRRIKIDLEDKGQDLLSMTLDKHGVVIDCNAQAWCWVGGKVLDYRTLIVGTYPLYERGTFTFKVEKITRWGTLQ